MYLDGESKMGVITSVNVILMDLFCLLLYKSENEDLVDQKIGLISLLIGNRVLMIAFGEGYFIYGYMVLYVFYASWFAASIAKQQFPFEGEVKRKEGGANKLMRRKNSLATASKKV